MLRHTIISLVATAGVVCLLAHPVATHASVTIIPSAESSSSLCVPGGNLFILRLQVA
jgi:hypothetical protein